eukprot:CAMPEP_0118637560 /NCGR_PEP_ID=MMETSP0785-20121206/3216_1 /TAXON_ID=91992 /ORGANISM="Bolidomonas pacifica, Strain CCMP 1866" /LENGTH=113 /DNA_ID=CAMNT_0006528751 /DNA_START=51 /DNA_END=389 /DNA_ORIENTATION=-
MTSNVTSTVYRGVLYKQRDHFSSYRPRLFVLDSGLLHYYYSDADVSPAKTIILSGCQIHNEGVKEVEGKDMVGIRVSHKMTSKAYVLACEGEEEAKGWIEALSNAAKAGTRNS